MMIVNIFRACYSWVCKTVASRVKNTKKTTFEFASLNPNERLREFIYMSPKDIMAIPLLGLQS
jgi:hypothetical protein